MKDGLLQNGLHASLHPAQLGLVEHLHLNGVPVLILAQDCNHLVVLQSSLLGGAIGNVSVQTDVCAELFGELWITGKCAQGRVEMNASEEGIKVTDYLK